MVKAQMDIIRKIAKLVFFSFSFAIIMSLSAPFSFTSNAYAIGIESTQSALDVLLATGGLDGARLQAGNNSDWQYLSSLGFDQEDYLLLYGGFFDAANNYYSGLGDYLLSKLRLASSTGTLSLSRSKYQQYLDFLEVYLDGLSTGDSKKIGSVGVEAPTYDSPKSFFLSSTGFNGLINGTYLHEVFVNVSDIGEFIILKPSDGDYYYFVPLTPINQNDSPYLTLETITDIWPGFGSPGFYNIYYNDIGYIQAVNVPSNSYNTESNVTFDGTVYVYPSSLSMTEFRSLIVNYRTTGSLTTEYDINTTLVEDVNTIATSDSSVDSEGTVSGPINIVINSSDVMGQVIGYLQSQSITLQDYLSSVGVEPITSGMTQAEIQELIESIPAISNQALTIADTHSQAITKSSAKVGALAHIEHSIANTIATIMGLEAPYPNEDPDYVPPGKPFIDNWAFPSLDPDNPDPGGSGTASSEDQNRAADIANAIPVVAGLASSIFTAASGFNLITTVGYSFVIFSAIIGAAHFFGALSGRSNDVQSNHWSRNDKDLESGR